MPPSSKRKQRESSSSSSSDEVHEKNCSIKRKIHDKRKTDECDSSSSEGSTSDSDYNRKDKLKTRKQDRKKRSKKQKYNSSSLSSGESYDDERKRKRGVNSNKAKKISISKSCQNQGEMKDTKVKSLDETKTRKMSSIMDFGTELTKLTAPSYKSGKTKKHETEHRDYEDMETKTRQKTGQGSKEKEKYTHQKRSGESDRSVVDREGAKRGRVSCEKSDEGLSSKETRKRMKYKELKRSSDYLDLDQPRTVSPERYWKANMETMQFPERSRDRTPVKIGGRYWDKDTEGVEVRKEDASDDAAQGKLTLDKERKKPEESVTLAETKQVEMLTTRTGGAYIPPAKLRLMQQQIGDKSSPAYQRIAWEVLKKAIHGLINKVNVANIASIVRELFKHNIIRGRGLLTRSIMQAQAASESFTHVYAALVAIINTKFPNICELMLKRLLLQFKRGFKRNDKTACISASKFIAHLVNQQVVHELIALEILTLLLEKPTDDSVEIAIGLLKEVGMKLSEVSPRGLNAVFESLRHVLNESMLDKRVQYMIEVMFQVRKDGFKDNPSVVEELDLVEEEDQMTHIISLEEVPPGCGEDTLNIFKHDPDYQSNEEKYDAVRREILGEEVEAGSGEETEGETELEEESDEDEEKKQTIIDETETNLTALRRTIYLTIQSSLDHNECAHKLMKMQLKPGQEVELCNMILDCCAQQRTYEKFFGLLAQRFCQIKREYLPPFQQLFCDSYDTIHRIDIGKLRNVAKFFGHLLFSDAISWEVLSHIHLNEEETTSASRIFTKILFQELAEYLGLQKLNSRLKDPTMQMHFEGIFPRDSPKNTRFSINFFTSIGLGALTEELREHLAKQPKPTAIVPPIPKVTVDDSSSSSSSTTSTSDTSSDSSDSEATTDYEVEHRIRERVKTMALKESRNGSSPYKQRDKEKRQLEPISSRRSKGRGRENTAQRETFRSRYQEERLQRRERSDEKSPSEADRRQRRGREEGEKSKSLSKGKESTEERSKINKKGQEESKYEYEKERDKKSRNRRRDSSEEAEVSQRKYYQEKRRIRDDSHERYLYEKYEEKRLHRREKVYEERERSCKEVETRKRRGFDGREKAESYAEERPERPESIKLKSRGDKKDHRDNRFEYEKERGKKSRNYQRSSSEEVEITQAKGYKGNQKDDNYEYFEERGKKERDRKKDSSEETEMFQRKLYEEKRKDDRIEYIEKRGKKDREHRRDSCDEVEVRGRKKYEEIDRIRDESREKNWLIRDEDSGWGNDNSEERHNSLQKKYKETSYTKGDASGSRRKTGNAEKRRDWKDEEYEESKERSRHKQRKDRETGRRSVS
ncbi:pre-mRNA-splicing factor CWC22 homolog [Artemia franciscana]|uniref:MI domain-containing protein n=1 Tax=Artemia franciscana TaxID=6661 RepID=A0AA88IJN5_ARTSF|nr:hypothetical protein QYM36_002576 [Artemia franciscana]